MGRFVFVQGRILPLIQGGQLKRKGHQPTGLIQQQANVQTTQRTRKPFHLRLLLRRTEKSNGQGTITHFL